MTGFSNAHVTSSFFCRHCGVSTNLWQAQPLDKQLRGANLSNPAPCIMFRLIRYRMPDIAAVVGAVVSRLSLQVAFLALKCCLLDILVAFADKEGKQCG